MIETSEEFMKTQSLIIYQPGHMGSFLINLLHHSNYKKECERGNLGRMYNKEWVTTDYANIVGTGYYNKDLANAPNYPLLEEFKKHIGYMKSTKSEEELLFLFAKFAYLRNFNYRELSSGILGDHLGIFSSEPLLDPLYTSVKYHPCFIEEEDFAVFDMSWKNIVYCYFPSEKLWIKTILHFEKMLNYFYFFESKRVHPRKISPSLSNLVDGIIKKDYGISIKYMGPTVISLPDRAKKINMYDLIFRRDLSEISDIFSDIDFSKRKYIIDTAYKDCMDILNFYNLDHAMSIPFNYDRYEFFYMKETKSFRDFVSEHYTLQAQSQNDFMFQLPLVTVSKEFISGITFD